MRVKLTMWMRQPMALVAVILAGCAAMNEPVRYVYDPVAEFSIYRSFAIEPVQVDSQYIYVNRMIKDAIARHLANKGLEPGGAKADLKVRFATEVKQTPAVDIEYVPTDQGIWTRYFAEPVTEGRLLVNVVDTKTGKVIWKGVTAGQIDRSREVTQTKIDQAVDELLANFPPESQPEPK